MPHSTHPVLDTHDYDKAKLRATWRSLYAKSFADPLRTAAAPVMILRSDLSIFVISPAEVPKRFAIICVAMMSFFFTGFFPGTERHR